MIEKRTIKAKIVTEYNEVKKCIDNNELVSAEQTENT